MMDGWGMNGWGWGGMTIMMVVGVLLVALLVGMFFRGSAFGPRSEDRLTADQILAQRLARGEIDEAEYQRRRNALHPNDAPTGA